MEDFINIEQTEHLQQTIRDKHERAISSYLAGDYDRWPTKTRNQHHVTLPECAALSGCRSVREWVKLVGQLKFQEHVKRLDAHRSKAVARIEFDKIMKFVTRHADYFDPARERTAYFEWARAIHEISSEWEPLHDSLRAFYSIFVSLKRWIYKVEATNWPAPRALTEFRDDPDDVDIQESFGCGDLNELDPDPIAPVQVQLDQYITLTWVGTKNAPFSPAPRRQKIRQRIGALYDMAVARLCEDIYDKFKLGDYEPQQLPSRIVLLVNDVDTDERIPTELDPADYPDTTTLEQFFAGATDRHWLEFETGPVDPQDLEVVHYEPNSVDDLRHKGRLGPEALQQVDDAMRAIADGADFDIMDVKDT